MVQIIFFIILPGIYISAFAGIKQIYTGIINHNFNFSESLPQLIEVFAVIPTTILLGRFFCGWMCAFGTLSDVVYHISSKFLKINFRISESTDKVLKYFKFIMLGFIVVFGWSFGIKSYSSANPWDVFGILFKFGELPDFSFAISQYTVGFFILLGIVAASSFVERFFCRYLCPLGAVFTIISKLRLTKIVKPSTKCGNCRVCTKSCPMGIEMYKFDKISSGECIDCLKCISDCPRKNVSIAVADEDLRPVVAGTLAVSFITGTYYFGSILTNGADIISNTSITATNNGWTGSSSDYADGTYQGSGTGFRGRTTTVSVIISNGSITDIQVVSYGDDRKWFDRAYSSVVSQILNNQSADVDAVSGATYSSMGIMEAVQDALNQSIAQKTVLSDESTEQNTAPSDLQTENSNIEDSASNSGVNQQNVLADDTLTRQGA